MLFIHNIINAVKSELKWVSEDLRALDKSDKAVRLSRCHQSILQAIVVNVMAFVQIMYYFLPFRYRKYLSETVEVIFLINQLTS